MTERVSSPQFITECELTCGSGETASHLLLASYNLAPELLARFQNGMIYRFIPGRVCSPADLRTEYVWKGVAARLGQWHATLPVLPTTQVKVSNHEQLESPLALSTMRNVPSQKEIDAITPTKLSPNVWTTMQKWIYALPTKTEVQKQRKHQLQEELRRTVNDLADLPGLGGYGLVLGHCDLLSGNVIKMPHSQEPRMNPDDAENVTFIDYEYASPAPAAFDLANHFAEWGGFDCDYSFLPTRATRRAFLSRYLTSYKRYLKNGQSGKVSHQELDKLCATVDQYRGTPGLYWGIWALIQAEISQIDFDYAAYAEVRLGEYFAWREEEDGSRKRVGREMHPREKRLAE